MKMIFLGTGAAEGIPCLGCVCPRCKGAREKRDKNLRARASLLLTSEEGHNFLIDTPPEIGSLLNRNNILKLSAVFLSHEHFDHIGGLTEFEYWKEPLALFAGYDVLPKIKFTKRLESVVLPSAFYAHSQLHFGKLTVTPFKVSHHVPCYGFLFAENMKRFVYFGDSRYFFSSLHLEILRAADVVIFHTPEFKEEKHHMSVENVFKLSQKEKLNRVILTHINHNNLFHQELVEKAKSFPNITVAYDRLTVEI